MESIGFRLLFSFIVSASMLVVMLLRVVIVGVFVRPMLFIVGVIVILIV